MRAMVRTSLFALLLLFTLGTASAWACNEPRIGLDRYSWKSGETVGFSVVNTEPGAEYTVYVDGSVVASGTDPDGDGVVGSFTGPRLHEGSRLTAIIRHSGGLSTTHRDDGEWPNEAALTPAAEPVPAPAPDKPANPTPRPDPGAPASAPERLTAEAPAPVESHGRRERAGGGESVSGPGGGGASSTGDPAGGGAGGGTLSERASSAAGVAVQAFSERAASAVAPGLVRAATDSGEQARQAARSRPIADGPALPAIPLVGMAVLVVLLAAAGAIVALRRRPDEWSADRSSQGPPWIPPEVAVEARARDALIEAELQEMIAEARARDLARERPAVPAGDG